MSLCKSCSKFKYKNGLYNKSLYLNWLEKLGKKEASKKLEERNKKASKKLSGINNPMYKKGGMTGKKHTIETKRKMRLSVIKQLQEKHRNNFVPNYNKNACEIIDWINKFYNYSFRHALNGGEIFLNKLGYFLDAYDKNKNIVIEFYERQHFEMTGKLKQKELQREQEIIEHLNCEFVRINAFDKNNLILEKIK